jgi:hypothetical protein
VVVAGVDYGDAGKAIEIISPVGVRHRASPGTDDNNRLDPLGNHGKQILRVLLLGIHGRKLSSSRVRELASFGITRSPKPDESALTPLML